MYKIMEKMPSFLLLIMVFLVQLSEGEPSPNAVADLKPHPHSSSTYNEFWTYYFYLDNGMKVMVNYSRVNAGSFKEEVCGADITVVNFEGKNYRMAREMPVEHFVFDPKKSRLKINPEIWFEGKLDSAQTVAYEATKNGVSYSVKLHVSEIAKTLDGGQEFSIGGEGVGVFIHIPRAKVQGYVTINGKKINVQGTVYMDHTYETSTAARLFYRGFRYIQHGDENQYQVGYVLFPREGKDLEGYGIFSDSLNSLSSSTAKVYSFKSYTTPKVYSKGGVSHWIEELSLIDESNTKANITYGEIYANHTVLDEFSGLTRWVVKKFLGGNVLNFMGEGVVNQKPAHYSSFYIKN